MLSGLLSRPVLVALSCIAEVCTTTVQARELPLLELQVVAPAPERHGVGPGGIAFVNGTTLATLDVVRQRVLLMDIRGRLLREMPLPENAGNATDIDRAGANLIFMASDGKIVAKLAATAIVAGSQERPAPSASSDRSSNVLDAVRLGSNGMLVRVGGGGPAVVVPLMTGRSIASVNGTTGTRDGGSMIWWEEIGGRNALGEVDGWVARFDPQGDLVSAARVPLELADQLPRQYVALSSEGDAVFQGSSRSTAFLVPLELVSREAAIRSAHASRRVRAARLPSLGPDFEALVRRLSRIEAGVSERAAPVPQRRSREEILAEARRYLEMNWTLDAKNDARADIPSQCVVESGLYWKRPNRLDSMSGKQVSAMPYRWGGSSSPESFARSLARGDLAGDVCTCREKEKNYCIVEVATGTDCSGFLSNAWAAGRHTTLSLSKISSTLKSHQNLLPGDALNNAGSHVRLFVRFEEGPQLKFVTLESSVNCGGVCERTYTAAQLKDYKPIRYLYLKP